MVAMASSWPMTRACSASSMWSSRSDSSWAMRVTGMPVHMATTWAMSSSPTSGVSAVRCACQAVRSSSMLARAVSSTSRMVAAPS